MGPSCLQYSGVATLFDLIAVEHVFQFIPALACRLLHFGLVVVDPVLGLQIFLVMAFEAP